MPFCECENVELLAASAQMLFPRNAVSFCGKDGTDGGPELLKRVQTKKSLGVPDTKVDLGHGYLVDAWGVSREAAYVLAAIALAAGGLFTRDGVPIYVYAQPSYLAVTFSPPVAGVRKRGGFRHLWRFRGLRRGCPVGFPVWYLGCRPAIQCDPPLSVCRGS